MNAYGPGSEHSYFLDLARVELGRSNGADGGLEGARRRLGDSDPASGFHSSIDSLLKDYVAYLRTSRRRERRWDRRVRRTVRRWLKKDRTLGELLADSRYEPRFEVWDYLKYLPSQAHRPEAQE